MKRILSVTSLIILCFAISAHGEEKQYERIEYNNISFAYNKSHDFSKKDNSITITIDPSGAFIRIDSFDMSSSNDAASVIYQDYVDLLLEHFETKDVNIFDANIAGINAKGITCLIKLTDLYWGSSIAVFLSNGRLYAISSYRSGSQDTEFQHLIGTVRIIEPMIRSEKIGDFTVSIADTRFSENYSGDKCVVITYEFTNNGKKEAAFSYSISDTLYQGGIEMDNPWAIKDVDHSAKSKKIKPGITISLDIAYILNNESDIEIELDKWISFTDKDKVTIVLPYSEIGK